jgi:hypothetical protein
MAVIEWKAPEQKHPLLIKIKPTKQDMEAVKVADLDEGKISRKFALSPTPLDDTGQLYFELVDKMGAALFWLHLMDTGCITELKYPSGNKIESPTKDVVTAYRMEDKVVFDIDGIQYSFLSAEIADPYIKDIEDPKEMAIAFARDLINRPEKAAPPQVS